MFDYVIEHNNSYRVSYGRKPATNFDDQLAIADYAKRVMKEQVLNNSTNIQLDYKQALSGTISFIVSDYKFTILEKNQLTHLRCIEHVTCVNKNYDRNITLYACPMISCTDNLLIMTSDCILTRNRSVYYPYNHDIDALHPTPIFFHTTGGTKKQGIHLVQLRRRCLIDRANSH